MVFLLVFISCRFWKLRSAFLKNNPDDTVNIFPVTSFLKAQLKLIDRMPVTPLKIVTENKKIDSFSIKEKT